MILNLFQNKLKGFYFFPVISFVLTLLLLKETSIFLILCLFAVILRLIFLKQKELLYLSLGMMMLALFFSLYLNQSKTMKIIDESKPFEMIVSPDTIKIDGNQMTFEGKLMPTKEKIIATYKLTSETEKDFYDSSVNALKIKGFASTQEIPSVRNLNGFDYQHYLEITDISQKIKISQIVEVAELKTTFLHPIRKIQELRRKGIVYTTHRFDELTSSFMKALLFGFKDNGPESFQTTWQELGVAHLFSLSGMHIYFFIFVFEYILLSIGVTKELLFHLSIFLIIFLMIITGAGAGMMRAGMQWLIKKLNQRFDWHLSSLDCWSLALLINCLFAPYVLLTVGGQLTYYLTFLIIFISPLVERVDSDLKKGWLFNVLLSWLSLPLIWYHFYEWNILNFILNIILGPILFVFILPSLLICFTLGILLPQLSFRFLETILKSFQFIGGKLTAGQMFRQVTGKLPLVLLIVLLILQFMWLIEWEKTGLIKTSKSFLLIMLTFQIGFWKYADPRGMLAFVDVGQGDAIFLQLPFNQGNYLLDTGGRLDYEEEEWEKSADKRGADYTLIPFMKSQGVKNLDAVFISHAHEDHFGDLDRISDQINVKEIIFGPGSYEQPNFKRMLNYPNLRKSQKTSATFNNKWQKGKITLDCLYPYESGDGQNNDSLVLKLMIGNQSILLMGDLEKEGENELLRDDSIDLQADILKVGHHGSKTSSQKSFLEAVQPKIGIISCGVNNRYQHPSEETLESLEERDINIFRTDQDGMTYLRWYLFHPKLSYPKTVKNY